MNWDWESEWKSGRAREENIIQNWVEDIFEKIFFIVPWSRNALNIDFAVWVTHIWRKSHISMFIRTFKCLLKSRRSVTGEASEQAGARANIHFISIAWHSIHLKSSTFSGGIRKMHHFTWNAFHLNRIVKKKKWLCPKMGKCQRAPREKSWNLWLFLARILCINYYYLF